MIYLLTLLSGVLTGLAMPGNLFSFLIWGSLIFFLKNLDNSKRTLDRFLHTFIFAFSMLFTTLWWQLPVLSKNIPDILGSYSSFMGVLGFIGEILLLSLPYLLIWLLTEIFNRKFRETSFWNKVLFYSFAYTSAEILKDFGDLAFSGGSLGYAIWDHVGLIQLASIFGYLGLTFLIVFVNSFLAFDKSKYWFYKLPIVLSVLFILNFSIERFIPIENIEKDPLKITAVQTNESQEIKYNINSWKSYVDFSDKLRQAEKTNSDLVIFSESTFMEDITKNEVYDAFKINVKDIGKDVILGFPKSEAGEYYNTAWYFDEQANLVDSYNKIGLTPFAEFLPYEFIFDNFASFKLLRFYERGSEPGVFDVNGDKLGVQICFETYFSEISNSQVKNGAEALISITNDGWFGTKTGLTQHFTQGIFRAVENRRDFVQVSNTGFTGHVDKYGRVVKAIAPFQEEITTFEINKNDGKTIYFHIKEILKLLILIAALIFAIL
ncbi:apolipoprotein N-acyltransferase [Geotoga petraea]|uniref:Apolipoprotein N-acyltransferase n=1 Tax=Geotoga petraea TaxID=28234 RepID=A0A1G6Q137_9BACT|nr:apolipoprotein N-acyltransferase [Geotoga petraea]SDC86028.1 apolipoprotein N-acyltransferase [Geotoga petraea]